MNYQLASAIIKGKWAIDPLFAINSAPLVADILNGKVDVEAPMARSKMVDSNTGNKNTGMVGIISIQGSLLKNDQECGPAGMATMERWVKNMDENHQIDAIVLKIDSPGGTVDGTQSFAKVVKNTKKPVVAYVDGLMASAALWIGSSANEVIASSELDEIGSVGVMLNFADLQPAFEAMGVKFHTITASQSVDKVKSMLDIRSGNYEEYRKDFLDPIAETFMNAVKENRPNVTQEHLTGKVFMAKNVMGIFVDSIGTLDDAINRALELASEQKTAAAEHAALNNNMSMKYTNIGIALGSSSLEFEADGSRTFSPEELTAVETALKKEPEAQAPDTSALDTATARVAELEAQIETLKNAPAVEVNDTAEATDDAPEASGEMLSMRDIELFNMIKQ